MQPMDLVVHIYWTASKELRLLEFLFIPKLTENIFNNVIDICYFSSYNFFNFWNIDDKLQWYILYIFTFLLHVLFKIPWRNITCNYYEKKNFIKKNITFIICWVTKSKVLIYKVFEKAYCGAIKQMLKNSKVH